MVSSDEIVLKTESRVGFFGDVSYIIAGQVFSFSAIEHGILRSNCPVGLVSKTPSFGPGDPRLEFVLVSEPPYYRCVCQLIGHVLAGNFTSLVGFPAILRWVDERCRQYMETRCTCLSCVCPWSALPFLTGVMPCCACQPLDNRIHFALNCGASSCPPVKTFTTEVRFATESMFKEYKFAVLDDPLITWISDAQNAANSRRCERSFG
jgi:hypothetical protein